MKCPYCSHPQSRVIDSRPTEEGSSIRRRRECESCAKRFTTYEKNEQAGVFVVKKDGSRQLFDREKLLRGILRSCSKRKTITTAMLENLVDEIEQNLHRSGNKEVPSEDIGNMVLEKLLDIDEIAYIRFASVYRRFDDLNSFRKELEEIAQKKKDMER